MARRRLVMVSSVLTLALSAAACGDAAVGSSTTTTSTERNLVLDTGVTQPPCSDAVNGSNGCIYLGVISDLTDGPFAAEGVPLTRGPQDFLGAINAAGGPGGWDVIVPSATMCDSDFGAAHGRGVRGSGTVLALARSRVRLRRWLL